MVVQLENQGNPSCKLRRPGLKKSERRGVGIASGIDRQLKMIVRIIARRVWRKTSRRAMLKPLIHRQNDQFPGPSQPA